MAATLEKQSVDGVPREVPSSGVATNFWMDESDQSHCLKKALSTLKARPIYLHQCSRDIAKLRRHLLVHYFYVALSKGGPNGNPRPIELHAYDAFRYVGDMLAWIHQAATSEKDFGLMFAQLAASDGSQPPRTNNSDSPSMVDSDAEDPTSASDDTAIDVNEMLDSIFEGLVAPFSIRVQQVLATAATAVVLYKVMQLLEFFAKTLEPLMQVITAGVPPLKEAPVFVRTCMTLRETVDKSFRELWDAQGLRLSQLPSSAVYTADLAAPQFVIETMHYISEVMEVFNTTLVSTPADQNREEEFAPILDSALNPVINFCRLSAHRLPPDDAPVYLINCYAHMQAGLTRYDFTSSKVELYASLLDEQMTLLVDSQAEKLLTKLGISERLEALRLENEAGRAGNEMTAACLHPLSLCACLRSFYTSLFTMGPLSLPQIDKIVSRSLRSEARHGVARVLAGAYEKLYHGTESLGVATHTPDQIRTLLE
eukprot:Selendium_serpulae@DN2574_c0_g1_i1.p1